MELDLEGPARSGLARFLCRIDFAQTLRKAGRCSAPPGRPFLFGVGAGFRPGVNDAEEQLGRGEEAGRV